MQLLKTLSAFGIIALINLPAQAQKFQIFGCPDGSKLNFIQDKNSPNQWRVIGKSMPEEEINFEGNFQGVDHPKLLKQADLTEVKLQKNGDFELICKYKMENKDHNDYFDMKSTVNKLTECKARVNFFMCI